MAGHRKERFTWIHVHPNLGPTLTIPRKADHRGPLRPRQPDCRDRDGAGNIVHPDEIHTLVQRTTLDACGFSGADNRVEDGIVEDGGPDDKTVYCRVANSVDVSRFPRVRQHHQPGVRIQARFGDSREESPSYCVFEGVRQLLAEDDRDVVEFPAPQGLRRPVRARVLELVGGGEHLGPR